MRDRNRQCIGLVLLQGALVVEENPHHVLHLRFLGTPHPHNRLLDLGGGVFVNRNPECGELQQGHPPDVPQHNRSARTVREEHCLNHPAIGLVLLDQGLQRLRDCQ